MLPTIKDWETKKKLFFATKKLSNVKLVLGLPREAHTKQEKSLLTDRWEPSSASCVACIPWWWFYDVVLLSTRLDDIKFRVKFPSSYWTNSVATMRPTAWTAAQAIYVYPSRPRCLYTISRRKCECGFPCNNATDKNLAKSGLLASYLMSSSVFLPKKNHVIGQELHCLYDTTTFFWWLKNYSLTMYI